VRTPRRRWRSAVLSLTVIAAATLLTGCGSGAAPSKADDAYTLAVQSGPVASAADIPAGSWMDKIRKRGYLRVGGTQTSPLFSYKNPLTGRTTGFDTGLSQMLAHYITGGTDLNSLTQQTDVTVDTRESLLRNGTVDAVFATYTMTPARAEQVAFAGPYYESGDAIMVKAGNTSIRGVADLDGRTVATESNSTSALSLAKYAPGAKVLLFSNDAQCVAAVQQGRADAYVLDQGILLSDASANTAVKVVGQPFTQEPYGIGLPHGDSQAVRFVDSWLQKIIADGSWARLWQATIGQATRTTQPAPPVVGSVPEA
jgi:glutamate transport system substrate-binding protein